MRSIHGFFESKNESSNEMRYNRYIKIRTVGNDEIRIIIINITVIKIMLVRFAKNSLRACGIVVLYIFL